MQESYSITDKRFIESYISTLRSASNIAEDENARKTSDFEKLELKNMSFSYEGQTTPALSDVNLTVNAGERVAIV